VSALLLLVAGTLALEGLGAWRSDRRLNGPPRRARPPLALALVALGRAVVRLLPALARLPPPAGAALLLRRCGAAGLGIEDLPALRAGGLVAAAVPTAAGLLAGGTLAPLVGIALLAGGAVYPELWLRTRARRRVEAIERQSPLALELLAATVAAGVPLDAALAEAAGALPDPLRGELELVGRNLALGRRRGEELRDLAIRTGSATLAGLALALRTSDELGVPLAEGLRRQAARARLERAHAAQMRAAAAAPKMLGVVVLLLVPAALMPLLAAVGLTLVRSFGGVAPPG
jgi:tight adherence protein C